MTLRVETRSGPVVGREKSGALLFAGIPYAAPPTGGNRFRPPQPVAPWTDDRDATRFSPASPQRAGAGLTSQVAPPSDEATCLTLNVHTPAIDAAARPVFVWIHGGAYLHGTGATPWYDGTRFARDGDVVTVSINYRLGALGFTRLDHLDPAFAGSEVAGILDQIAALEWVRDNIAAFGGNPDAVTVGGESAGAFSVATLLAMPEANGLFHQAILQSGAGHAVNTADQARAIAGRLLDTAGVATPADLQALDIDALLDAQETVHAASTRAHDVEMAPFYPSTGGVLPQRPIDAIAAGAGADVRLLIGTNEDESALFGVSSLPEDRLEKAVRHIHPDPTAAIDTYRATRPDATAGWLAVAIMTDHMFRVPAVRLADAREAHGGETWFYRFDWKSRAFDGGLGACHALEIPFVFNNLDKPGIDMFLGEGPLPQHVADAMHAAWTSFIRHGRPGENWPRYRRSERNVYEFADDCGLVTNPAARELAVWDGVR